MMLRIAHRALAFPLFGKILVANAVIVGVGVVLGGAVGERLMATQEAAAVGIATLVVAGVALSFLLNAIILRFALMPLKSLESAAARVQAGDLDARAPISSLADSGLARLVRTFNGALDGLAASRRRLRRLFAQSSAMDEEKRSRVAHALEDETAQRLAALLLQMRLEARSPDQETVAGLLEQATQEVAGALDIVREFASACRPAVLEELGLVAALEADARRVMDCWDAAVRVEAAPLGHDLAPETEVALYRILTQALDNAARHAAARAIHVRIARRNGAIVGMVEDDGQGFDPARVESGPGLGLLAMLEGAESLGGRVSLRSRPGRGTRVVVEMPAAVKEESC
jgi:two-component system sensor histidine kinase UhpB